MARVPEHLWPVAFGVVTVAGTVLTLGIRAFYASRTLAPSEPDSPWRPVDIEQAMPTLRDFPMGWQIDDAAAIEDYSDPDSSHPSFFVAWKILRLNTPSTQCDPPCSWIGVWAASNSFGVTSTGWMPFYTRDDALDFMEQKYTEVS